MLELCCVHVMKGIRFVVEVDPRYRVDNLKIKIKEKIPKSITCDEPDIDLYLAGNDEKWLHTDFTLEQILVLINKERLMDPFAIKFHYFNNEGKIYPKYDDTKVHVLIDSPAANDQEDALAPNNKKQSLEEVQISSRIVDTKPTLMDNGSTDRWLMELNKHQITQCHLPLVAELEGFIQQELPVKISITEEMYKAWSVMIKPQSPALMKKLFQVSDLEPCMDYMLDILRFVVGLVCHPGDTESSFHSFWDTLIRNTLDYTNIDKSNRGSNRTASTGPNRPDLFFVADSV
ncbi:hypothetical protein THRCLA_23289 [Thraustotheca clavata]|uniref:Crinkler effector protein N-terminal domain-containing protein n=1 Tax=Thraustotheca clavata TaxID=74557 RepID=A0A1V9Y805_9STRA|nr:hypothetical protein THRCLA_23289 [Thraustotheca clavata]